MSIKSGELGQMVQMPSCGELRRSKKVGDFGAEVKAKDMKDVSPEEAKKQTPVKFSEHQWRMMFQHDVPYEPNKVFYGHVEIFEGKRFLDNIHDENGEYQGQNLQLEENQ